jgi:hypothetical protein
MPHESKFYLSLDKHDSFLANLNADVDSRAMSTDSSNEYAWTETSPGRWERDIDEIEQFYTTLAKLYEGSGRMFFAITGHISLSIPVPQGRELEEECRLVEEALRKGWTRLRYDHPTIGARTEYDARRQKCVKVYETFSIDTQQRTWMDETFYTISPGVTGADWCNSDPPAPKVPTLFMITPPTPSSEESRTVRRDVIFRSPHDIIDGIGTLQLLNNLFKHVSEAYILQDSFRFPPLNSEVANLSPSFRVAANLLSTPTQAQRVRFDEESSFNTFSRQGCEVIGIPFKHGAMIPGKHQRVALTLSQEQTTKLLQACRRVDASVTHIIHAAIAMSMRDMQEQTADARKVRYISYCLINERSRCIPPFETPKHAVAVYHSVSGKNLVVDLVVPAMTAFDGGTTDRRREEFKNVVKNVESFYRENQQDTERIQLVPLHIALKTPPYPAGSNSIGPPQVPAPNMLPSVSMSSFGVIENFINPAQGHFKVYNPWVTGEELGTGLGVYLGTWKGQLCVSAAYNDAWHDESETLEYLRSCINLAVEGLMVEAFGEF